MIHLYRSKEPRDEQQQAGLYTEAQGKEETCHNRVAFEHKVNCEDKVQHHDLIVEHRGIVSSGFFIGQHGESN